MSTALLAFTHSSTIDPAEPPWSSVDKTKLPRMAFADHGEEDKKSTWKYPHHWVKNGGNEDETGVYTTGTMYLHEGGWQAAMNAAHGARSGQRASQEVMTHLEGHRGAIDRYRKQSASFMPGDFPACWANHMGFWCIEGFWFQDAVTHIKAGTWHVPSYEAAAIRMEAAESDRRPYAFTNGVAIIDIVGPMMKARSKFGGTSTVDVRNQIHAALTDDEVKTLFFHIESPGGHVAGTQELADDIYQAGRQKHVLAHIEDLGASAAYWAASQCHEISANMMAEIGSIGTVAILVDTSGRMERLGVYTHVISTGQFKGLGVEGSGISPSDLDYVRERVEGLNEHFQASLLRGRRMTKHQLAEMSDGRVHGAAQAKVMGLIDKIMTFHEALDYAIHLSSKEYLSGKRDMHVPLKPGRRKRHAHSLSAYRHIKGV